MTKKTHIVAGYWRFKKEATSIEQLEKIANEWKTNPEYIYIYIRNAGRNEVVLGFSKKYDGKKETQDTYWEETTNYLKNTYPQAFLGTDIASVKKGIKGF